MITLSPCVGVCRMDKESGFCVGCGRSRDEIKAWGVADEDEKRAILARLETRPRSAQG